MICPKCGKPMNPPPPHMMTAPWICPNGCNGGWGLLKYVVIGLIILGAITLIKAMSA